MIKRQNPVVIVLTIFLKIITHLTAWILICLHKPGDLFRIRYFLKKLNNKGIIPNNINKVGTHKGPT